MSCESKKDFTPYRKTRVSSLVFKANTMHDCSFLPMNSVLSSVALYILYTLYFTHFTYNLHTSSNLLSSETPLKLLGLLGFVWRRFENERLNCKEKKANIEKSPVSHTTF